MINAAKFREVHRHAAGLVLGEPLGDRALEQKGHSQVQQGPFASTA